MATRIPFFGYQLQFVSGELEKALTTKKNIRQFLLAMYGARTSKGEVAFDVTKGALLDKLPDVQPSQKLMSEEVFRTICLTREILLTALRNWTTTWRNTLGMGFMVHVNYLWLLY